MSRLKVRPPPSPSCLSRPFPFGDTKLILLRTGLGRTVDENLYYRGIHKEEVDHIRRDQSHGLSPETLASPALPAAILQGPEETAATAAAEEEQNDTSSKKGSGVPSLPLPYLFRNAAGLVRLTQQHNVSRLDSLSPAPVASNKMELTRAAFRNRFDSSPLPSCEFCCHNENARTGDCSDAEAIELDHTACGGTNASTTRTPKSRTSCSTCGESWTLRSMPESRLVRETQSLSFPEDSRADYMWCALHRGSDAPRSTSSPPPSTRTVPSPF